MINFFGFVFANKEKRCYFIIEAGKTKFPLKKNKMKKEVLL